MKRLLLSILMVAGGAAISCTQSSRTPSPSQQATGSYRGELSLVNEITGDTIESQGGIKLRVDPMEPELVKLSFIRLRFANRDFGDVQVDANIQRLNDTYLVMSAHNKKVEIMHNSSTLEVYVNGWHDHDDINLTMRTSVVLEGVPTPLDVVISYVGSRG